MTESIRSFAVNVRSSEIFIFQTEKLYDYLRIFNPYWQITETKSENREITHRVSRKQNPEKF